MPRKTPEELLALDRHLIHPHQPLDATDRTIFVAGKGSRLWDVDGREYLDATGGLWLAQVGHGREEIADAVAAQTKELEYFTSFWGFTNSTILELIEVLREITPDGIDQFLFTSGGSESDEAALKTARYYWYKRGKPTKNWILSRTNAYHGTAFGGGSASGFPADNAGLGPLVPHIRHLTPPHAYRTWLFDGQDPTDFCIAELERTIAEIGADNIAAFIGEPVMGVGGMVPPPADYWPRVEEVLRKNDILFIFDEVVTGFGRTGSWFAAQRFGVQPDIMAVAKGITSGYIPLGAMMTTAEIADTVREGVGHPTGYTYSGHPVAAAASLANLAIMQREGLVERANSIGDYLADGLQRAVGGLEIVGEIRHTGMAFAIELTKDSRTHEPLETDVPLADVILQETGVIVRASIPTILVASPALTLSEAEADQIVSAIASVLVRLSPDGTLSVREAVSV